MSQADGSIIIDTKIDQTGLSSGLDKMQSVVKVGVAATVAAIGAMSAAVISLGSEFEMANAAASTLFGDAQVDMTQYQGKMLELSTKTGLAASELGMTMYDALSSGIPASDDMSEALGFLEKNTKLAKAGFTDVNTATTATAKVLNAYKMDVAETDRVHKVLMQTQNLGITTVNELGSVLSQVTPTASAMSVSFEQVGAALAGMTAQGTPTAQATTQLNQLIAELGKSGTQANTAMMDMYEGMGYGRKSFKELMEEGVTLADIIVDMEGYAQDNDKALIDMFGSLEAGKAALSMAGENAKTFTTNLDAMSTSADVVGDAYDKVTDTFKDKSEKVVNSLKNVGISAYSKFEKPLKSAMDSAQLSIENLSDEMSNGKLGKSVDKVADGFGDLVATSIDLASKALPLVINGFAFVVENGEVLTVAFAGLSAAVIYYKNQALIANSIESLSGGLKTASMTATVLYATAQNVLAGSLTVSEGAHMALNAVMASSPIGMVTIAVGALAAGVALMALSLDGTTSSFREHNEAVLNAKDSYKELEVSKKEMLDSSLGEIQNYQNLKKELDFLVDANGKVKEGYEGRAQFIVTTLNQALGLEMELVDGTIVKYEEAAAQMDTYIEKMKASAILEAQAQSLKKAEELYKTNQDAIKSINEEIITNQSSLNDRMKLLKDQGLTDSQIANDGLVNDYQLLLDIAQGQKDSILVTQSGILTDKATYYNNLELMQNGSIESLKTINASEIAEYSEQKGRVDKSLQERASEELLNVQTLNTTIATTKDENHKKQLLKEIEMSDEKLAQLQEDLASQVDAVKGATPKQQQQYSLLAVARLEALKSQSNKYFGVSELEMNDLIRGLNSKDEKVRKDAEAKAQLMIDGLKSKDDEHSTIGANIIAGITGGVNGTSSGFFDTMASVASRALTSFKKALGIKSPSREFAKLSKFIPEGISKGIEENEDTVIESINKISDDMISTFSDVDLNGAFDIAKQAIYAEQMKMAAVVDTQAKVEVMKTNMLKVENKPLVARLDGQQIIKIDIDGREMAIAIAPMIAEELAFN